MAPTAVRNRSLDRVYGAIADPTRRAMLALLAGGDATVGALAGRFPITFNGASKHVKVLERAGLVTRRVRGREHWLRLAPRPLLIAARWLEHYRDFWDTRLAALEMMLVRRPNPRLKARLGAARRALKGRVKS